MEVHPRNDDADRDRRIALKSIIGAPALFGLSACVGQTAQPETEKTTSYAIGTSLAWLDRLADLRALPQNAYSVVILKGYYEPGDGGGGPFHWTADTTASDDGGTVILKRSVIDQLETRTGCWKRLAGSTAPAISGASSAGPALNVKWFGAKGDGTTLEQEAIQRAINACGAAGGGIVFFPPGTYNVGAPLYITHSRVILQGSGLRSTISATGVQDTIRIHSTPPGSWLESIQINDLFFNESGKIQTQESNPRLLYAERVANFVSNRLFAAGGINGLEFHNFNNVTLNHPRIEGYRGGWGTAYVRFSGGASIPDDLAFSSDTARIQQGVFGGFVNTGIKGIDIDGRVNSVTLHSCHVVSSGDSSLHLRNTIGASSPPSHIVTYDFETDYPRSWSIQIDCGRECTFEGNQLHGAKNSDNIYVNHDSELAQRACRGINFIGGFVSGADYCGIQIRGNNVTVDGVRFRANSASSPGSYSAIFIASSARGVTIRGCRAGELESADFHKHGCEIAEGADNFAVIGNVFTDNKYAGILNSAGTSDTKIAVHNAG